MLRAIAFATALLAASPAFAESNNNAFDVNNNMGSLSSAGGGIEGRTWIKALTGRNYWDMRASGEVYSRDPGGAPNHGQCRCGR